MLHILKTMMRSIRSASINVRGVALLNAGDTDGAMSLFNEALSLNPKNYHALNSRANALREKGDLERAHEDYTKVIEARGMSKLHLAFVNRAMNWISRKNYAKAFADFASARTFAPSATEANLERSLLFAMKGDYLSSVVDNDEGMRIENPRLYAQIRPLENKTLLRFVFLRGPTPASLIESTRRLIDHYFDPDYHAARAEEWGRVGEWELAIVDLIEAISLNPSQVEYRRKLEDCIEKAGFIRTLEETGLSTGDSWGGSRLNALVFQNRRRIELARLCAFPLQIRNPAVYVVDHSDLLGEDRSVKDGADGDVSNTPKPVRVHPALFPTTVTAVDYDGLADALSAIQYGNMGDRLSACLANVDTGDKKGIATFILTQSNVNFVMLTSPLENPYVTFERR
jgi:tetratricopeptide (TPR) repeat protein